MKKGGLDCIIVLGAGLKKNGQLDRESKERVKKGCNLYRDGFASHLLMCGGVMWKKTPTPLAIAMKDYAKSLGIPSDVILTEEKSLDTLGNAIFSKEVAVKKKFRHILLITSDYHLERALFIFHHVYGSSFMILGIDVPTGFIKKFILASERNEQKFLMATQLILTGTKEGDAKGILKRLQKVNPIFNATNRESAAESDILKTFLN